MQSDPKIHAQNQRMIEILSQDAERYQASVLLQRRVFEGKSSAQHPLLLGCNLELSGYESFNTKQIHYDSEKMLHAQLTGALGAQAGNREAVPSVRANMGCGIVPALFGLTQALFDDKMPWLLEHLSREQIMEMKPSDLTITPEFKQALDHMEYMAEALAGSGCALYPLDIQGAFDTAHLVYGDEIFYDLYDEPEFVHHLLDLSCHAIEIAFEECLKRIPGSDQTVCHYNCLAMPRSLGGIKLSEDTPTLLGGEQIEEFVKPYMHRLLKHFGGGYIHYCGENPHLLKTVLEEPLAYGLNFGNPEKHNMDEVLNTLSSLHKVYYGAVPMADGESFSQYFERALRSSFADGQSWLLLSYNCAPDQRDQVDAAWSDACEQVYQNV